MRLERRYRILSAALVVAVFSACASSLPTDLDPDEPAWVRAMIAQIASEPVTNPPSSIIRYRYNGATVYYRPARCCDIRADLYDRGGTLICQPDGGITGDGDGMCTDFAAGRSEEHLVWADPRR